MKRFGPIAALAALALIWGYNWVVMKQALEWTAPVDFAALRSLLGGLCLLPVLLWWRGPLLPVQPKAMLWLALLQTIGFVGCIALALAYGPVGKSTVLAYTMPLWAVLFAAWLLGERILGLQWLALALAGVGLIGIISPWQGQFTPWGTGFALAAGLWWGIAVVVGKRLKVSNAMELVNVAAWQMLIGGGLLWLLGLWVEGQPTTWNAPFMWALASNAILASALAWLLWLYVLQNLSAAVSSLGTLSVPIVSITSAWLVLGEVPSPAEAIGMLLILGALVVLSLAAMRASGTTSVRK